MIVLTFEFTIPPRPARPAPDTENYERASFHTCIDVGDTGFDSVTSRIIRTVLLSGPAANSLATPNLRVQRIELPRAITGHVRLCQSGTRYSWNSVLIFSGP